MIELEGKISNFTFSILVDPRASLSYISPKIVESCQLQANIFKKYFFV